MHTPLNGILGMVEMLHRKPSAKEQALQLSHLNAASRQLAGLIDEVLDFSKIDQNVTVIHLEPFSSQHLIQDLNGIFSLSAQQKGITFSILLNHQVSDWLHGDMHHLRQVLTNLIGNAIKFTKQGEVRLTIPPSQASSHDSLAEAQANQVTFEVLDTGDGIEAAQLARIFLPYYQIEDQPKAPLLRATRVGNTGTGLGLAISEGLAKAMGGSLVATSELGKGSCFILDLTLPSATGPDKDKKPPHSMGVDLSIAEQFLNGINIMLVEDSIINQQVVTIFLQETGANISICDTGATALAHFKAQGADVILMDYRLPDIDGLATSEAIRTYEQLTNRPQCRIIMHTADNRRSLSGAAKAVGISQLLPKPFTQAKLINAISQEVKISSRMVSVPLRPNTNPKLMPMFDELVSLNLVTVQQCMDALAQRNLETLSQALHKCLCNAGLFGLNELAKTISDVQALMLELPFAAHKIAMLLKQAEQQLKGYGLWSDELG